MTPEFRAQLEAKLVSLRQFVATWPHNLSGARLVQYCAVDFLAAVDFPLEEIERQVTGSVCGGFFVDWICRNQLLYLRVFEFDRPKPSWERVFAQEDLADVKFILREAGFGDDA